MGRVKRSARLFGAPVLMCGMILATLPGSLVASASGSGTKIHGKAINGRVLVQQGLAIALASNVLQSQLTVLIDATNGGSGCVPMTSGIGSSKILRRVTSGDVTASLITIYYNGACTHPYIEANAHMVSTGSTYAITESADYLGTTGDALGLLRVTEDAVISDSKISVHGTGAFTPHDGAPVVHLGLSCALPGGAA